MKFKDALDRLDKTYLGDLEWKMALSEALEKQIPQKPVESIHKYIDGNTQATKEFKLKHCPNCWEIRSLGYFESLVDKGVKYCHRCGQAIDWSESE